MLPQLKDEYCLEQLLQNTDYFNTSSFRMYAKTTFLCQFRINPNSTCVHALISMEIFRYNTSQN